jgi:hypothetical protein
MMRALSVDYSEQRFGKWVVLSQYKHDGKKIVWQARCDCGTVRFINAYDAKRGKSKSCGCEMYKKGADHHSFKHGKAIRGNPEFSEYKHRQRVKTTFGIEPQEYDRMFEEQDGVCAICKKEETATRLGTVIRMPVDHCHTTGQVRGLLCDKCNKGIGHFFDDPDLLRSAADYLERTRSN